MQHPLAGLTAVFCLGILTAGALRFSFAFAYGLAAAFLILSLLSLKRALVFKICLLCLVFFLGAALLRNYFILPKCHIARHIFYKGDNRCRLECFVISPAVFRINRTVFAVEAKEARFGNRGYKCCGRVQVYLKGRADFNYGEALLLEGRLSRPYLRRAGAGIYALLRVDSPSFALILHKQEGSAVKRLAMRLKKKVEELICRYARPLPAAVLNAMLLGEKKDIPPLVYQAMMKTGTVHILVVSGFNTSLVIFAVVLALKALRLRRCLRFFIALPLLFIYCLTAGASTPVVRATIMTAVFMSSYLLQRQADIYNSCALSALFILFGSPAQLFDVGAQLSFASVLAIAYLYPKMKCFLRIKPLKIKVLNFFCDGFLVSLSAWLGTMGIVAYNFRIFSPVTLLANMFIVPLATLVTLCGFSLIAASLIAPVLAPAFASAAELAVTLLVRLNSLLVNLPGAYFYLP